MPETLPVDPAGAGASPDPEREARIEELLLAGLDRYFAGRYEEAISIWTRVAFLERGHGRARAYIERARGAQAERERESEELLNPVFKHAEKPEFVYCHRWKVGDLLLWDNRSSMHARKDFPSDQRRVMWRTQILGTQKPV